MGLVNESTKKVYVKVYGDKNRVIGMKDVTNAIRPIDVVPNP